ncbi:ubiquitin-conjugating enzyme family protein [Diaporthe amygdali]|uniref:ubiquitin-conjugating enzyme family protein n=1 Tax=Phomopsis amygdali TaxID=1214568 RepID=UPI0022FF3D09|nr:ubiquitin-conjugating enzyme family protein [Diaporthe amygdali]KAJ0124433.1 ubiquitin-conjugating enzyme family protein [Diaporthe amygdali]
MSSADSESIKAQAPAALHNRLGRDVYEIHNEPYTGVLFNLQDDSLKKACLVLKTSRGVVHTTMQFKPDYPLSAPVVLVDSPDSHPDFLNASLCVLVSHYGTDYTPAYTIKTIAILLLAEIAAETAASAQFPWRSYPRGKTYECDHCGLGTSDSGHFELAFTNRWNELYTTPTATKRSAIPRSSSLQAPAKTIHGLPSEILLLVLNHLPVEDILRFSKAWGHIDRINEKHMVIRNRELQCFITKEGYKQSPLGIGLQFSNPRLSDTIFKLITNVHTMRSVPSRDANDYPRLEHQTTSLLHPSDKAIQALFSLFHILLCLAVDKPECIEIANNLVKSFQAGQTSAKDIPRLEHLVVALLISDVETDESFTASLVTEVITRNVPTLLTAHPGLSFMEPDDAASTYRIGHTFWGSLTPYRVLMFAHLFQRVVRPVATGKTLEQSRDALFAERGLPHSATAAALADGLSQIRGARSFDGLYRFMGLEPIINARTFSAFLRHTVRASMAQRDAQQAPDQRMALVLRWDAELFFGLPRTEGLPPRPHCVSTSSTNPRATLRRLHSTPSEFPGLCQPGMPPGVPVLVNNDLRGIGHQLITISHVCNTLQNKLEQQDQAYFSDQLAQRAAYESSLNAIHGQLIMANGTIDDLTEQLQQSRKLIADAEQKRAGAGCVDPLLQNGAELNAEGPFGFRVAHIGADRGHLDLLRMVLQRGANPNAVSRSGDTPAHVAAWKGYLNCLKVLFYEFQADLRAYNGKAFPWTILILFRYESTDSHPVSSPEGMPAPRPMLVLLRLIRPTPDIMTVVLKMKTRLRVLFKFIQKMPKATVDSIKRQL